MTQLAKSPAAPDFGAYQSTYAREAKRLADDLTRGAITLQAWRDAMVKEVGFLVIVSYAAGKRVDPLMLTPADWITIRRETEAQVAFVVRWYEQMKPLADAAGLLIVGSALAGAAAKAAGVWNVGQTITAAGLLARALLYGDVASVFVQMGHGAAIGLPILPAYPKSGSSACKWHCYCKWDITHLGGKDFDCTWVIDPERDNCPQCIARAIEWRPLKVVGGVVQPFNASGLFV